MKKIAGSAKAWRAVFFIVLRMKTIGGDMAIVVFMTMTDTPLQTLLDFGKTDS